MPRPALRVLLVDLSGTLHIGSTPTPAAVDALKRIREAGFVVRFCSNTSKESTAALRSRLGKMGFEVNDGELWTSLGALKDVVKIKNLCKPMFLLSESAMEEFPEFLDTSSTVEGHHSEYDSVVIGLSPAHFNYDTLTKAFRVLASSSGPTHDSSTSQITKPSLITTHRAKYIRTPDGNLSLGPGPFVAALEEAVGGGLQAEVVGKPTRTFFERVIASIPGREPVSGDGGDSGVDYGDIAIIGDDIETDLGGAAVELGLWRVLVKTGKYQLGDEKREGRHPPNEVQDSFASFVDDLLKSG